MNPTQTTPAPAPAPLLSTPFQRRILGGLNVRQNFPRLAGPGTVSRGHIYGGTVDPAEVARRRAANKAARKARRAAR